MKMPKISPQKKLQIKTNLDNDRDIAKASIAKASII